MARKLDLTDVAARLSQVVAMVAETQDHVEITRHGKRAAIIVSCDEWDALQETIAILADRQLVPAAHPSGAT